MEKENSQNSQSLIREIKRKTRKKYSSEEKIRIIISGMRGEDSISDLCRKEGMAEGLYYKWSKCFFTFSAETNKSYSPPY